MSTKQSAPKAPNYAPIIAAQSQAAQQSQALGQQQYDFFRNQYAADRANTDKVVQTALDTSGALNANAAADRTRYTSDYVPAEKQFLQNAERYNDPTWVAQDAAAAAGDVSQQFDVARDNARRQLEAYGVDPTQTRAQALDLGTRTQEAAARASAMNVTRRQDAQEAQKQLGVAIGQGQQTAARGLQETGLGLQAGSQAVNADLATTASGASTMGTAPQFYGLQNQSLGQAASTMNQGYQNRLSAYQANQQASSGIMGLAGSAIGAMAGNPLAIANVGSNLRGVFGGGSDSGLPDLRFADGGAVPDDIAQALPVNRGALPVRRDAVPEDARMGIIVDRSLSPSGGLRTDDVPARLNAGEFVLPRETVEWYGQRHFQNVIRKAAQESAGAEAKPRMSALPVERPVVRSAALDVRR